jgi:hypothetical protein
MAFVGAADMPFAVDQSAPPFGGAAVRGRAPVVDDSLGDLLITVLRRSVAPAHLVDWPGVEPA